MSTSHRILTASLAVAAVIARLTKDAADEAKARSQA